MKKDGEWSGIGSQDYDFRRSAIERFGGWVNELVSGETKRT